MVEPTTSPNAEGGGTPADAPGPTAWGSRPISDWVEGHLDRYTEAALVAALVAAGHDEAAAQGVVAKARHHRDDAPVRRRATRLVLGAYGVVYAILMAGLLLARYNYGIGVVGAMVLTVVFAATLTLAWLWMRNRRAARAATVGTFATLPLIALLILGGLCVASTGTPFYWLNQAAGAP